MWQAANLINNICTIVASDTTISLTISPAFSEVSPEYITFVTLFFPFVTTIRITSHPMAHNFFN